VSFVILKHVASMFVLAGKKSDQANAGANTVLAMETEMATAAMDPVARRDPKNLNNKMSLAQVKALTPSLRLCLPKMLSGANVTLRRNRWTEFFRTTTGLSRFGARGSTLRRESDSRNKEDIRSYSIKTQTPAEGRSALVPAKDAVC
jgi:hypothetical protein